MKNNKKTKRNLVLAAGALAGIAGILYFKNPEIDSRASNRPGCTYVNPDEETSRVKISYRGQRGIMACLLDRGIVFAASPPSSESLIEKLNIFRFKEKVTERGLVHLLYSAGLDGKRDPEEIFSTGEHSQSQGYDRMSLTWDNPPMPGLYPAIDGNIIFSADLRSGKKDAHLILAVDPKTKATKELFMGDKENWSYRLLGVSEDGARVIFKAGPYGEQEEFYYIPITGKIPESQKADENDINHIEKMIQRYKGLKQGVTDRREGLSIKIDRGGGYGIYLVKD